MTTGYAFDAGWGDRLGSGVLNGALGAWREAALARLAAARVPTRKDEAWRFIKLGPLLEAALAPSDEAVSAVEAAALDGFGFDGLADRRVVFVDGRYAPELSTLGDEAGARVRPLSALSASELAALGLGDALATLNDGEDLFEALNAAAFEDGLSVDVRPDTAVSAPIHLLWVSTGQGVSAHPRLHVRARVGAKVTIVEDHVSLADGASLTNAAAEFFVEGSATIHHVKLQRESGEATHVSRVGVDVGAGGQYEAVTISLGAALSRYDQHARVAGGEASCALHGLAVVRDRQVTDTHSTMDHRHAHTTSDQLHKCVIADRGLAVFNGRIFVRQDAQQVNAFQLNRNLLRSDRAQIHTKPQLEIFADDVKCSHGATIGQLQEDQVFYLRSRGIDDEMARGLLTYAFAAEVLEHVPVPSVRAALEAQLSELSTL